MPDISKLAAGAFSPQQEPDTASAVMVFRVLHGAYGTLFLSRFSTGVVDDHGRDKGVAAARTMWAQGLRAFDANTVRQALERCMEKEPKFPPTLPELQAQCRAIQPRKVHNTGPAAIGMSDKLRSEYAKRAREINERHEEKRIHRLTGYRELSPGLHGLFEAIADAVRCAGGDEVAELRRLGDLYPRSAA